MKNIINSNCETTTSSSQNPRFTEEDLKLCVELLKTLEFSELPFKAIIITTMIPTGESKRYDIENEGTYFLFGKEAWQRMVGQLRFRAGSESIYSTYMDVPIIESDEKASEIIVKADAQQKSKFYLHNYTGYLASVSSIPLKIFTGS